MDIPFFRGILFALVTAAFATSASAITVGYNADLSNKLPSGTDYLSVVITETGPGQLLFDVGILPSMDVYSTTDMGVRTFGFNLVGSSPSGVSFSGLPAGWGVSKNKRMSTLGVKDFTLGGTNGSRNTYTSFSFSVTGLALADLVNDYTAHIVGIDNPGNLCGASSCNNVGAFVYSSGAIAAVPVPAAAWLFITGVIGLVSIGRRRA